ncbi:glycosyltransferase family 25 protein [Helicobacter sp.]|uniref:glycosyltransferase family 25 protein n=1 Tax=Helicobacter sp. TaxID=218 RepID=UPI0025BB383A|nr:glycosyltransferase family 25 protein [Helicobacter sp.]MCI5968134.1 glycosyltransferase family 25 protein [Helicobacter sp.]MDY2585429.1 glycosyltransferase family 25 protein [Helicobacter sp.]
MQGLKFFIINLASAKERREYISRLCRKYQLDYEIIEAVNGRELSGEEIERVSDAKRSHQLLGRTLTQGEIGCALSHKKAFERMFALGLEECVILEDDAWFDERLGYLLSLRNKLPKDLEVLLLGHYRQVYLDDGFRVESPFSRRFDLNLDSTFHLKRLVGGGFGTHALYWKLKGAKKMFRHLEKIFVPYDHSTSDDKVVNVYALYPVVVETDSIFGRETSVQETNANRTKKRPKWRKYLKRFKKEILFLIPSFKGLRDYA